MKEKEFLKKFGETLPLEIYYYLDDEGEVVVDSDLIRMEFEEKMNELCKDQLKKQEKENGSN